VADYPDDPPTEWDCTVFLVVAETKRITAAAEHLAKMKPNGKYTRQAVTAVLGKLRRWSPQPLLEQDGQGDHHLTEAGRQFLDGARNVVTAYKLMRHEIVDRGLPTMACFPHHLYFVARAENNMAGPLDAPDRTMIVKVLDHQYRGETAFHRHAVERLRLGVYHWVVGPPVEGDEIVESMKLYSAQLEAMVPVKWPRDEMSLTELVRDHRMIAPPAEMRSRSQLEQRIREWEIPDERRETRVAGKTIETSTSVLRLRLQAQRHERARESRVLVAPSDVALAYKPGMEFAGHGCEQFKWVPLYHSLPSDNGSRERVRLLQDVHVTWLRHNPQPAVAQVVDALVAAVHEIESDGNRYKLSGERRPAVPGQRQS
jgi:Bacterial regulatory helix-turn-helix protein, lysR family